jgi:type VI secretion system secreted protein VgrG
VTKKLEINAGDQITLQSGSASIALKKDGTILIKGKDITIEGAQDKRESVERCRHQGQQISQN